MNLYERLKEKADGLPIAIAICNDKGGSAKTTTAINLSEALARLEFPNPAATGEIRRLKILLIDGDDSRTCSIWGKRSEENRGARKFSVCNEKEAYSFMVKHQPDVLIYDTAGGIKTHEMNELAGMCHFFILPCKPDFFNSVGTFMMAEWLIEKNKPFKILISDTPVGGNYARGNEIKELLENSGKPFFKRFIKRSAKVTDANNFGKTVFEMPGARDLADSFSEVALETLELIGRQDQHQTPESERVDLSGLSEAEINQALANGK